MNISYNWLKEYLQFDLTPDETAEMLTDIGLETESVSRYHSIKGGLEGLVIGEVLTSADHPNADNLKLTTVDIGNGEAPLKIVCGAPNVAAGQKVVVATIGTTLYSGEQMFKIKRAKIRDEESVGMICAEDEIGVGSSHEGIIVLPDEIAVGTPAKDYYNLKSDWIFEVDITPNRIDAASHYGVARDLAARLKQVERPFLLTKPSVEEFKIDKKEGGINIRIEDKEGCPRYSGLTIRGVTVKESPDWLKQRLESIGLRPINNIVDITNFVLYETGHPMHAFDAAIIPDNQVVVRTLPEKSRFVTLDEVERELSDEDLMISNSTDAMCIAGVFGGLDSGVTEKTTDVFLESAYFNPGRVRRSARRHGLNTDSSFRFERGTDPNNTIYVLKRAAMLVKELAGGIIEGDIKDIYPIEIERAKITLSYDKLNRLVGKTIPVSTIRNILNSLEMEILSETKSDITLYVPTYRVDVTRDVDMIEDILRIYGYNNVEFSESLKASLSYQTVTDRKYKLQTVISEQLTANGFNEIMNNSLTKKGYYEDLNSYPLKSCVSLLNPLSNDLSVMRQTLLFGGLESLRHNRNRKHGDLRLYEFGNCYFFNSERERDDDILAKYSESTRLGIWIIGRRSYKNWAVRDEQSSVFELKAYIENIFQRVGIERSVFNSIQNDIFSTGMTIFSGKEQLGSFGIVSQSICREFDIKSELFFAELEWDKIMEKAEKHKVLFTELSKFPAVNRDLALLIDKNISFAEIEEIALKSENKLLKRVTLFDVYEGGKLPENKKSYAVNFLLMDQEKTLTDERIDKVMEKIQHNLELKLGAQLR